MKKVITLALMLMLPHFAVAEMYMCVDQATGETSFTDKACETEGTREEIRVNTINPGSRSKAPHAAKKTWRSEAEVRKTGSEYNAERRSLYENEATASAR